MDLFFHANIKVGDFSEGFIHPLTGVDHLLAMVSVGVISTFLPKKHIVLLPLAFVTAMFFGALSGIYDIKVYFTEQTIALSVLCLGLLIYTGVKPKLVSLVYGMTALFGIAHGYAHGIEIPFAATPEKYFFGFLLATTMVHIIGIIIGIGTEIFSQYRLSKILGMGIAISGMVLIYLKF